MSIHVTWDNEAKTMLRYDYRGTWNWEELYLVLEQGYALTDSVSCPVGAIIDMTGSSAIPPGVIMNASRILRQQHPRLVVQAVITEDRLVLVLAHSFLKLYQTLANADGYRFVTNITEARLLVAERLAFYTR